MNASVSAESFVLLKRSGDRILGLKAPMSGGHVVVESQGVKIESGDVLRHQRPDGTVKLLKFLETDAVDERPMATDGLRLRIGPMAKRRMRASPARTHAASVNDCLERLSAHIARSVQSHVRRRDALDLIDAVTCLVRHGRATTFPVDVLLNECERPAIPPSTLTRQP
jgi:hypothetical protein